MQDDLFYFAAAACFAVLLAAATFGFAPPAPLEVIEISPSPFTRAACSRRRIVMAQNPSGKRGNAPQVAVVIGVVLILIGAWNLVNVLVPATAISSLINFIRHFVERRGPAACLLPAGICCGRLNLESCRALRSLATMRRFRRSRADKRIFGVCGGIAYYFGVDATVVRIIAVILLAAFPPMATVAYLVIKLFFVPAGVKPAGAIRGVDFEPSRFRDIIG